MGLGADVAMERDGVAALRRASRGLPRFLPAATRSHVLVTDRASNEVMNFHTPTRVRWALLAAAMGACSSGETRSQGATDAAADRVEAEADGAAFDAADAASDSVEEAPVEETTEASTDASTEAGGATCSPPCGEAQVCCTDQHGHFPTCRSGSSCSGAGTP